VVEPAEDLPGDLLQVTEIDDHAERIELLGADAEPHPAVVPVEVLTAARVPANRMRGREGELLADREHRR